MEHRLSPRESRHLVRRFQLQDDPSPRVAILFASGVRRPGPVPAGNAPAQPAGGAYELEYSVSDGYLTERAIILP